jgi:hypothetical protein
MRNKTLLFVGMIVLVMSVGVYWNLPYLANALLGEVRARLPQPIIDLVTTPLPTALPAPVAITTLQITIPTIVLPSLTPAAADTAVPTPTLDVMLGQPSAAIGGVYRDNFR